MSRTVVVEVSEVDVAILNAAADLSVIGLDLVNGAGLGDMPTNMALGTMYERLKELSGMVEEALGAEEVEEINRQLMTAAMEAAEERDEPWMMV